MPTPEQALRDIGERITKVLNQPGVRMLPLTLQVDALICAYVDETKKVDELQQEIQQMRKDNIVGYESLRHMIVGE